MSFYIFTQNKNTVYVHGLPIHDHGIQRGLSGLIWAPAIADAAITLLHFTTSTAHLHCIQHRAAGLQGAPRYSTTQNTVRHPVYTIYHENRARIGGGPPPTNNDGFHLFLAVPV